MKNILKTYHKHRSFNMLSVCLPYVCHRFTPNFRHLKMAVSYVCKHMNNTGKHMNYKHLLRHMKMTVSYVL